MDLSLAAQAVPFLSRAVFLARQRAAGPAPLPAPHATRDRAAQARRSILFITVDQQRFDALGVNGGRVARTPRIDALARAGLNYRRAHVQNVVCMPSRATMLTGQHPHTHGVFANGVALPASAPSVAELLRVSGYRTALLGKAHFDPHLDLFQRFTENRMAAEGQRGPWHGFEHVELATHGAVGGHHYAAWLWKHHPEAIRQFGSVLTGKGGGDTGAPEVTKNPMPTERYHTAWVAARTRAWLRELADDEPFFCWMSFPDPHHPFDPPYEEVKKRLDWRDVPLPAGYPGSVERARAILRGRPRHWLDWLEGRFQNPEGGPASFRPGALTTDQIREVNAMIHVENELIDDACGSVLDALGELGRADTTDVFYTSDHGELQGDLGLMFKGPYHVESLLRVPMIWAPAPSAAVPARELSQPIGHVDLAPTFLRIAGLEVPGWMQGAPLPTTTEETRERVLTTFDSQFRQVGMHLRTIFRDGMICTVYEPHTQTQGGDFPIYWALWGHGSRIPVYTGVEGELYAVEDDPHQFRNLFDDPTWRRRRDDLVADLRDHLPAVRTPALPVLAPT